MNPSVRARTDSKDARWDTELSALMETSNPFLGLGDPEIEGKRDTSAIPEELKKVVHRVGPWLAKGETVRAAVSGRFDSPKNPGSSGCIMT